MKFHLFLLSLLLFLPLARAEDCSELLVGQGGSSAPYTPSKWHMMGDRLASQVVGALTEARRPTKDSIWNAFSKDPRFLQMANNVKTSSSGAVGVRNALKSIHSFDLNSDEDIANANPIFFLTWEEVGLRAINRLTAHGVFLLGLTDHEAKVDGRTYSPEDFTMHDLAHARLMINSGLVPPKPSEHDLISRIRRDFDYERIMSGLSPREKILFDFGYFLFTHEFIGSSLMKSLRTLCEIKRPMTKEILQKVYRNSFHGYEIEFEKDGSLQMKDKSPSTLGVDAARFADPGDLRVNLPLEIKARLRSAPHETAMIISSFLEEVYRVLLREHYAVASSNLISSGTCDPVGNPPVR